MPAITTHRRILLPQRIDEQALPPGAVRDFHGLSMGTSWSVRLLGGGDDEIIQAGLQGRLDQVVSQMSHWQPDSSLGRFNAAPAGTRHVLPEAFFKVLSFALSVSEASGGACDPRAGALVNLWGFGPHGQFAAPGFTAPSAERIQAELRTLREGAPGIELDPSRRSIRQPGGLRLDLSAVAKGYAVDSLARWLEAQGVRHYLAEVGGELRGGGYKPDGQPWWVELEQPGGLGQEQPGQPAPLALALHGLSVATSGDYRRYFQHGEQHYSHTIDPRSGYPIANTLASVTVVHAECMAADAWSTALTVLGPGEGPALAERLGLAARFVLRRADGYHEILSSAMARMLDD